MEALTGDLQTGEGIETVSRSRAKQSWAPGSDCGLGIAKRSVGRPFAQRALHRAARRAGLVLSLALLAVAAFGDAPFGRESSSGAASSIQRPTAPPASGGF